MPLDFNGTDQVGDMGRSIGSFRNISEFSISAWVRSRTTLGDRDVGGLSTGNAGGVPNGRARASIEMKNNAMLNYAVRANDAEGDPNASGPETATGAFTADEKFFYVGRVNLLIPTGDIFKNAVNITSLFDDELTANVTSNTESDSGSIGGNTDFLDTFWDGTIEDMRLYSRWLTDDEILSMYTLKGNDGIVLNLEQAYRLNEYAPGVLSTFLTSLKDAANQQRNATPLNSPVYAEGVLYHRRRMP